MIRTLVSQATRIAKNEDLAQDIVSMAFMNYQNAQSRDKDLSIGELVNFMKHRAGELRTGKRLSVGNVSTRTTNDVYSKRNYFNGNVDLLSMDYKSDERDEIIITAATSVKDSTERILFEIGFEKFMDQLSRQAKKVVLMRLAGYNMSEISKKINISKHSIAAMLNKVGRSFIDYFQLSESYLKRYGIA